MLRAVRDRGVWGANRAAKLKAMWGRAAKVRAMWGRGSRAAKIRARG